ncbi:PH domain-containing protein [Schaalia sp. 19OD2882]|uniref:PH domain-containing protein n=1 Tax=Schaalia sp. 19OD2882 TaxID=2794089 RepID=UPI001C1ED06E|nr:PH domain-containing protein [Schaalia sp. 19OD2882]QWW19316.1 PH domain-containing protein [Schaalia sp. 19OD2882]
MGLSAKLLSRDEVVVRHMRTHVKAILWNIIAFLLLLVLGALGSALLPAAWAPFTHVAIWAAVAALSVPVLLVPYLRWVTTTYTLTSKRVITRHGIFTKLGHDLPLSRISDVSQERDLVDQVFGCGSLTLQTSSDDPLVLSDVPKVHLVQVELSNLLFHDVQGAIDADPTQ